MNRTLLLGAAVAAVASCTPIVSIGSDGQALKAKVNQFCEGSLSYQRTHTPKNDHCLRWAAPSVLAYQVDARGSQKTPGDEELAAIDRAFASWQTASDFCSDWKFVPGERVQSAQVLQDGKTQIVFRESLCDDVVAKTESCWADLRCGNK